MKRIFFYYIYYKCLDLYEYLMVDFFLNNINIRSRIAHLFLFLIKLEEHFIYVCMFRSCQRITTLNISALDSVLSQAKNAFVCANKFHIPMLTRLDIFNTFILSNPQSPERWNSPTTGFKLKAIYY